MNFFKSVFSDDPDPNPNPSPPQPSPSSSATTTGAWKFGDLIKTLSSKSESIIETYRRDLHEFGTGLKKEIEVAHGSVGHVIDELGTTVAKGTSQIISKSKDAIRAVDNQSDYSDQKRSGRFFSRLDAAVRDIQGDAGTYCDEPEDLQEFNEWKLGFSIDAKNEEMERLLKENEAMEGVYKSVVPKIVDHDVFWLRYYYKVSRLKKDEDDVRARIVKGMNKEEEDLSWEVDDDDDDNGNGNGNNTDGVEAKQEGSVGGGESVDERGRTRLNMEEVKSSGEEGLKTEKRENLLESKELGKRVDEFVEGSGSGGVWKVGSGDGGVKETIEEGNVDGVPKFEVDNAGSNKIDEKMVMERKKVDDVKSTDKNDGSKHLFHQEEEEEEELGWDEIEDLSSIDEKKITQSGSTSISKIDLRKRLSAAEEEEELSWDIEEDEEPAASAKA
ncbi:hypothetical protein HN51_048834 [Arachis hypogaea]|uniref:ABC transporter F family member 4 n=1 Tax=Arachis ipaensis TaxID=130454 RepID=UPI0007AF1799|nr:ABC transporter F family member 4 [Arachis ipaensis]XP_025634376.1 ABC transporter F family member 4 [Arachis hypogaea]QHO25460.1 BSD domain-containing protein [Arachis hypogaea]